MLALSSQFPLRTSQPLHCSYLLLDHHILTRALLVANLFAGEPVGSLHCCRTHPVVRPRPAVQGVRRSLGRLLYHLLLWDLSCPAWTPLEDLQTHVMHTSVQGCALAIILQWYIQMTRREVPANPLTPMGPWTLGPASPLPPGKPLLPMEREETNRHCERLQ